MPNVRFVEGTADDYSTMYESEWPIVPRAGEFLSITVGTEQVREWTKAPAKTVRQMSSTETNQGMRALL